MLAVGICFSIFIVSVLSVVNFARGEEHTDQQGTHIHGSTVDGYRFEYYLLDLRGKETQHTMVYIQDPEGNSIRDAKVGFLIIGPDGTKQKAMAMGMKGAFSADISFQKKAATLQDQGRDRRKKTV